MGFRQLTVALGSRESAMQEGCLAKEAPVSNATLVESLDYSRSELRTGVVGLCVLETAEIQRAR